MRSSPIPTSTFALTVVKQGRRVLLIKERDGGWSIPGGRMQSGETLRETALREVLEEASLKVDLEGILKIQYTPMAGGESRLRAFFLARPAEDRAPKSRPDLESLGAQWFTREEMLLLTFRSDDVMRLLTQALDGPVYPMTLLEAEN